MAESNELTVVYETEWDSDSTASPTHAIVDAVATVEDADFETLTPLNESVDPDALDRLISPTSDYGADQIVFQYCGYDVLVSRTMIQLRTRTGTSEA